MKRFLLILIILSFAGCSSEPPKRVYEDVIEITEINPNRRTALTKQNLFHLAKVYDLKPFLYTKKINVQSYVTPQSHPVLTLNTRNADRPDQLLATWLHEEFHWWIKMKDAQTRAAVKDFVRMFPKRGLSEYNHLVICYLEYRALVHYLGTKGSREIINGLITDVKLYPWVYTQVLKHEARIASVIRKHKLVPPPLK